MEQWLQWAREGGAVLSPFLFGALIWLNIDRKRLLESLQSKDDLIREKDDKLEKVSERTIVFMAEIRTFLFQNGRAA